jgi:hypothetical protein
MSMANNHFLERYNKIIEHYKINLPNEKFCEKHHILPKCLGGNDSRDNLILLPARAHIIVHYILHKAYPNNHHLAHAFAMMCINNKSQDRKFSSKIYESSKLARSNALKNIPRPEWVKEKLRKPKANKEKYFGNTNAKGNKGKQLPIRSKDHTSNLKLALQPYYEKVKQQTKAFEEQIRNEYCSSGLSRKEFAIKKNMNYTTLKKYLRGL